MPALDTCVRRVDGSFIFHQAGSMERVARRMGWASFEQIRAYLSTTLVQRLTQSALFAAMVSGLGAS